MKLSMLSASVKPKNMELPGVIILFLHGFENGDEIIDAFRICEA